MFRVPHFVFSQPSEFCLSIHQDSAEYPVECVYIKTAELAQKVLEASKSKPLEVYWRSSKELVLEFQSQTVCRRVLLAQVRSELGAL